MEDGSYQDLPETIGSCRSKRFHIDRDLSLIETHFTPNRKLAVLSKMQPQEPRMVLTLSLSAESSFQGQHSSEIKFKTGYGTISSFNFSEGSRQYQANHSTCQLRFSMTQRWLENYFGEGAFANNF